MPEERLIGVDVGGTKSAVVLGQKDEGGGVQVLERLAFATETDRGPEHALGAFRERARELVDRSAREGSPARAVGVSCGGPLDSRSGVVLSPPNLPGWDRIPIVEILEKETGLPTRLENDANAGALAEWLFGAGRGARNVVFCTMGTGFGTGMILDGRLYSGTNDNAGELGHVRLAGDGPAGYGKRGSVEGFCSGGGIAQLAHAHAIERLQRGETVGFCRSIAEAGQITARDVGEAAEAGDPAARALLADVGRRLGQALAALIDVVNPERIVLGSIFARQHAFIWPECERVLGEEALAPALAVCRVVPAELGESIGDLAALAVAVEAGKRAGTPGAS
jgi:glucokinase